QGMRPKEGRTQMAHSEVQPKNQRRAAAVADSKPCAKSWREVLPIHPAAELSPLMSEAELGELGEDIKQNGLRVPLAVYKEQKHLPVQLLDGRNRLDAMELVGLSVCVEELGTDAVSDVRLCWRGSADDFWSPLETLELRGDQGDDPYAYVVSTNI